MKLGLAQNEATLIIQAFNYKQFDWQLEADASYLNNLTGWEHNRKSLQKNRDNNLSDPPLSRLINRSSSLNHPDINDKPTLINHSGILPDISD